MQTKVVEKIKTHILCSIIIPKNFCVYGIMWEKMLQPDRLQMTIYYSARALHAGHEIINAFPPSRMRLSGTFMRVYHLASLSIMAL